MSWRVLEGDCREVLRTLELGSVQTCVTSPPYFGLRDYGHEGQLGLEPTPQEYVAGLVDVFREVRRVLRDDGTVWLNLGDSYAHSTDRMPPQGGAAGEGRTLGGLGFATQRRDHGLKPKDLIGIPWRVAFALQEDGWYLRSDIIWAKPNPMPESVTDRPTKAHEYLFLLAKGPRYYYDAEVIRSEDSGRPSGNGFVRDHRLTYRDDNGARGQTDQWLPGKGANKRSVWEVPEDLVAQFFHWIAAQPKGSMADVWRTTTQPYPGAHFATFPPKLIEPCVLAGAPEDATVLDPFAGAGTTGLVATRLHRSFVGIELNPTYAEMARQRIRDDAPLLNTHTEIAA